MKIIRISGLVLAMVVAAVLAVAAFAAVTDTSPDQTGWPYDMGGRR